MDSFKVDGSGEVTIIRKIEVLRGFFRCMVIWDFFYFFGYLGDVDLVKGRSIFYLGFWGVFLVFVNGVWRWV